MDRLQQIENQKITRAYHLKTKSQQKVRHVTIQTLNPNSTAGEKPRRNPSKEI
jgi:hypothetical protein